MKIRITYLSGDVEVYSTTYLPESFAAGTAIENNYLHFEGWQEKGIRLTRSYIPFATKAEEQSNLDTLTTECTLIAKEELDALSEVTLDGNLLLIRADDRLMTKIE